MYTLCVFIIEGGLDLTHLHGIGGSLYIYLYTYTYCFLLVCAFTIGRPTCRSRGPRTRGPRTRGPGTRGPGTRGHRASRPRTRGLRTRGGRGPRIQGPAAEFADDEIPDDQVEPTQNHSDDDGAVRQDTSEGEEAMRQGTSDDEGAVRQDTSEGEEAMRQGTSDDEQHHDDGAPDNGSSEDEDGIPVFDWVIPNHEPPEIPIFRAHPGVLLDTTEMHLPIHFFQHFVDVDMVDNMVQQTNEYGAQFLRDNPNLKPYSPARKWVPVDRPEMYKFLGLTLLMDLVRKPEIRNYWSTEAIFCTPIFSAIMPRERYLGILHFWHFSDNTGAPDPRDRNRDRIYKLCPIIDHLNTKNGKSVSMNQWFCSKADCCSSNTCL